MVAFLILPDGREVEVRDGLVLGRLASADVVVNDSKASRRHAVVHCAGSVAEIEDLASSNGTMLNGKKVQRRALRDGDAIQIGACTITYREGRARAAAKPAIDDDELVFDDEAAPAPVPARARPVPAPPPVAAPAPPPAAAAAGDTLEFLDEVVQVRQAPPPPRRPDVHKPAASGGRDRGVLQFHKVADRRGVLAEDMQQMSSLQRALLWLGALAVAGAMGYLAIHLAR
ncbi:MAG: FHA domain-containing protein [Planctomycetota bacterium]